jgi:tetratricopeptide (TPR) repeat protein
LKISKKPYVTALAITILTIFVYLPVLQNDFVNWDDDRYVYENPDIQSFGPESVRWMFTAFHASNWHPLTWFSHAIDHSLWGLNPLGHHLTSIVLHGLNTFLVVILITRLVSFGRNDMAVQIRNSKPACRQARFEIRDSLLAGAVTGLLFGLHPLHVESVAWISERKDVLCAFFTLLSMMAYLRYSFSEKKTLPYCLCLFFFILALMSKPMAVTLPVIFILFDIYPLQRLKRGSFLSVFFEKLPFFAFSVASSVVTIMAQQTGGAIQSLETHPLGERLFVGIRAIIFYLVKMVWPDGLAPLYPYPLGLSFMSFDLLGSLVLVFGITVFCVALWRRQKAWSALWAYYLVSLFPVLGIIQVGGQAAADRYTYLPSLGPFLLAGLGCAYILGKTVQKSSALSKKALFFIPFFLLFFFLSSGTRNQITIWKDSLTLWNTELTLYPDFSMAYKGRGKTYSEMGNYRKALTDYNRALELNPSFVDARVNRGNVYLLLGLYQKAIKDYDISLTINPRFSLAYYNRGLAYEITGAIGKAVRDFQAAARLGHRTSQKHLKSKAIGW